MHSFFFNLWFLIPNRGSNFRTLPHFNPSPLRLFYAWRRILASLHGNRIVLAFAGRARTVPEESIQFAVPKGEIFTMMPAWNFSTKVAKALLGASFVFLLVPFCKAQDQSQSQNSTTSSAQEVQDEGTSTDLFIMLGSDFDRPGLVPRANDNIGIGHTFGFLKKDPFGDELTVAYTYEDAGSGFWHSDFGSHTESVGVMKNFGLPKTKWVSGYTWVQVGVTTFTGIPQVQSHFYDGESLGAIVHFNEHNSSWIQETFNKIVSSPWYTTTSIGYTRSW